MSFVERALLQRQKRLAGRRTDAVETEGKCAFVVGSCRPLDEEEERDGMWLLSADDDGRGRGDIEEETPRKLLRRWGKIRSKSVPDRVPDDFFKFTNRNGSGMLRENPAGGLETDGYRNGRTNIETDGLIWTPGLI